MNRNIIQRMITPPTGHSPMKAKLSFNNSIDIASTPKVKNLKQPRRFSAMTRTLSWKMTKATKCLMDSMQTAKGQQTLQKIAAQLFKGNKNRAISYLVAKLQTELKNKHFRLVEENMQLHIGSPVLDPLCFAQPDASSSEKRQQSREPAAMEPPSSPSKASCQERYNPLKEESFDVGDEVSVHFQRNRLKRRVNLKHELEKDRALIIATILRLDEPTHKALVLHHGAGTRAWYRWRHLTLVNKCPDVTFGDGTPSPASQWIRQIDDFDWDAEMAILRKQSAEQQVACSSCGSPVGGEKRQLCGVCDSLGTPGSEQQHKEAEHDRRPSSTRELRNQAIISCSRMKALLRSKKSPTHAARSADTTPFQSSEATFKKRLLLASNPGISQWARRHFELKNDYLNVYMKNKCGRLKYLGSYCLRDFANITVDGQRVRCTFAMSNQVKLILHARTCEYAVWWARRMRLHQAYFAFKMPGMESATLPPSIFQDNEPSTKSRSTRKRSHSDIPPLAVEDASM